MNVRKARASDVGAMTGLIQTYAHQGLMLPRSRSSLYETLRDFSVVDLDGHIVAVGALCILWEDLAEIRSLAVAPDYTGRGIGKQIVHALIGEAEQMDLERVFALTYQTKFFESLGFTQVRKETLPQKVWKDCVNCSKFSACDEIAMIRTIRPSGSEATSSQTVLVSSSAPV